MRKLIVGLCLMLITSGSFGLSIKGYKQYQNDKWVDHYIVGAYHGLEAYNHLIDTHVPDNVLYIYLDKYCAPDIEVNGGNLRKILDTELKVTGYGENILITFPLYDGLVKTFPCKE